MGALIDDLYEKTGLEYLSDLHVRRNQRAVLTAVEQIQEGSYPKEDWVEAYQYITGDYKQKSPGKTELLKMLHYRVNEETA